MSDFLFPLHLNNMVKLDVLSAKAERGLPPVRERDRERERERERQRERDREREIH